LFTTNINITIFSISTSAGIAKGLQMRISVCGARLGL